MPPSDGRYDLLLERAMLAWPRTSRLTWILLASSAMDLEVPEGASATTDLNKT